MPLINNYLSNSYVLFVSLLLAKLPKNNDRLLSKMDIF